MPPAYKCDSCKTFFEGTPAFYDSNVKAECLVTLCQPCYDVLGKPDEGEQKLTFEGYEKVIAQFLRFNSWSTKNVFLKQGEGLLFVIESEASRIKKRLEA